jgi:hypothetical protein
MKQKTKQFEDVIMKKKNDHIMVKEVYFWIILSLESTNLTFFCLLKFNFQQNWIREHEWL